MSFLKSLFGYGSSGRSGYRSFEALTSQLLTTMQTKPGWQPEAVALGKRLFAAGGRNYMMMAYAMVESNLGEPHARALSICWDGIGRWNGGTGGIQVG
jgi:hypothetical protein